MADDLDYAAVLKNMLQTGNMTPPKRVQPADPNSIRSTYYDSTTPDLTPAETSTLRAYTAFNDPQATPGVAFMRAGKVPPVGELSSQPSANIEDRTRQHEVVDDRGGWTPEEWFKFNQSGPAPDPRLMSSGDLQRVLRDMLVPLPRPRPRMR